VGSCDNELLWIPPLTLSNRPWRQLGFDPAIHLAIGDVSLDDHPDLKLVMDSVPDSNKNKCSTIIP